MPIRDSYTSGTPNWVDIQTPDVAAAKDFYGALFGWQYSEYTAGDAPPYVMATIDGREVAAIAPHGEHTPPDSPARWNTYLAADDVDAAAGKVADAGGKVLMGPFDIQEAGRMAWVVDPTGVDFGLWQAGEHIGARWVNEPGALTWNELVNDNQAVALPFYESILGVSWAEESFGEGAYTLLKVADQPVGGSTPPPMPGVANQWHVYFEVEDVDATAAKAAELGAERVVEPFDTPAGRMATLRDPQGGIFSVIHGTAPEQG